MPLTSVRRRTLAVSLLAGAVGVSLLTSPASAAGDPAVQTPPAAHQGGENGGLPVLVSPPRPPAGIPRPVPADATAPAGTSVAKVARAATDAPTTAAAAPAAAPTPPGATTFGPKGPAKTLVLYDSTGEYGWLGELYALAGGTLATHFGSVTAEPVTSYVAGQLRSYTAALYLGSTYEEPLPAAFISDVTSGSTPVVWAGYNVWQLAGSAGSTTAHAFTTRYGWDASTSQIDTEDAFTQVQYKGQALTRSMDNEGGLLVPVIKDASAVKILACASGGVTPASDCSESAQAAGVSVSVPWAIRSSNLTYMGEIPFSYMSERDRYLAFADLLFPALAPQEKPSMRAAVRLEDVNPMSDPNMLRQFADYLFEQKVPFQVGIIPEYDDPNGADNDGVPETVTLAQAPDVVSALKYMHSKGGELVQHGYTHQYSNVANPYNGVTADDFEFYRAECSSTQTAPYSFGPCALTSWVIQEGPLPGDSQSWAEGRVRSGRSLITKAKLPDPKIFETPHYAASAADYRGMRQVYSTRYERELFFGGLLNPSGSATHVFGQFFPYSVTDVYDTEVLPEDLGNYEPTMYNNNPPRSAQDIVDNAAAERVVTQSVASFFFHPDYPLSELQKVVSDIEDLGYDFVPAAKL